MEQQLASCGVQEHVADDALDDDGLNQEQRLVVEHVDGPLLVGAVAGSGKTKAVVHRVARLALNGADPNRILAVTFSVKAAKEMNTRLSSLGVHDARIGTFHSLGWQIVRTESPELARWTVDDRDRYRTIVKDALGYRHMDWKSADLTAVTSFISRCKGAAVLPGSDAAVELARKVRGDPSHSNLLCQAYFTSEELRRERRILTYDDQLLEAWRLLSTDEACRCRWAARWDYVMQDESQDENLVQREIVSMLARDHRRYMVVGDPSQAIFGFRGADPSGMLRFAETWGAPVVGMVRNYRSGRGIIALANRVIDAMDPATHLGVRIVAERVIEGVISTTRYASFDEEGEGVVTRIRQLHEDGRSWRDCAVLYRTNAQSRGVEEALLSARVPYVVVGGANFYDRKEVKDLLAYLRLASGRGTFDDVRRAINTPFRYLGKVFVDSLESVGQRSAPEMAWTDVVRGFVEGTRHGLQQRQCTSAFEWCSLIDKLTTVIDRADSSDREEVVDSRPARVLEGLITDINYMQWLTRDEGTESPENNRVSNVRELIRASERFPTVDELLDYIDNTLQRAAEARANADSADCVVLTTLHRSKGLEWPVVSLIGVNQKILPHVRAEDIGEERRLFYVGVTRARDELHISCVCRAAVGPRVMMLQPSQFLSEGGLQANDHGSCRDIAVDDHCAERS